MEKQTRVSKYKELREEMKEEVAINPVIGGNLQDEEDDFLAFIPRKETRNIDDTLMEPLTYETLDHDNEDVRHALNEAKMNVGKEKYDTRLDILNKIKQDNNYSPAHSQQTQETVAKEQPQKKMTLLEKLAAMSPEEDAEELKKYEEELNVEELKKKEKKKSRQEKKTIVEEKKEESVQEVEQVDNPEENDSKLVTILNYIIIAFIIIFLILIFMIVKQCFFN